MSALAREAVRHGHPTLFTGAMDIAATLAERRSQGASAYQAERARLRRRALIVLDDFCLVRMGDAEIQGLFDLLNDREGSRGSVAVLSQKDPERWNEELGYSAIGEALVGRIVANSITITLGTGSRRRPADTGGDGTGT